MRDAGLPDFDCIVETLEAQAGAGSGNVAATPACALKLLGGASGDRRTSSSWTLHLLAIEAGKEDVLTDGFMTADPLFGPGSEPPQWALVRAALERLQAKEPMTGRDLVAHARLAAVMAGFEAACGEHDEALRLGVTSASIAARRGPLDPRVWGLSVMETERYAALPGVLLLRAGRTAGARDALAPLRGSMPARFAASLAEIVAGAPGMDSPAARGQADRFFPESIGGESDVEVCMAVFFDDGESLSGLVARGELTPRLLRVAGFTTRDARGLDALSAWLRRGRAEGCHGRDVGARFADVSARLAVAEEVGDEAMIAELRGIAGAFRRALLRRETALPLLLLEQIKRTWVPPVELALGDLHTCSTPAPSSEAARTPPSPAGARATRASSATATPGHEAPRALR
jgi:hypothetical protein